jgi:hypothetical protein
MDRVTRLDMTSGRIDIDLDLVKGGSNVYGSYPEIDELFPLQADELDPKKLAAILEKMQQLVYPATPQFSF